MVWVGMFALLKDHETYGTAPDSSAGYPQRRI